MNNKQYNILFLCTGNSARSILAECALNRLGKNRFKGFSAGSFPVGKVHPMALKLLQSENYPIDSLRSKSWDEFARDDSPKMDFIFTVCDNAANETCPAWLGRPASAHWGLPDPAAITDDEQRQAQAFADTWQKLVERIERFINLPLDTLDPASLKQQLDQIGQQA